MSCFPLDLDVAKCQSPTYLHFSGLQDCGLHLPVRGSFLCQFSSLQKIRAKAGRGAWFDGLIVACSQVYDLYHTCMTTQQAQFCMCALQLFVALPP